jgi:hypothetical protein
MEETPAVIFIRPCFHHWQDEQGSHEDGVFLTAKTTANIANLAGRCRTLADLRR